METTALTFHIDAGMRSECLKFAEEVMGSRSQEHEESRRRLGITAERVWIEATNAGDMLIFYLEAEDTEESLNAMGSSSYVYDLWFHDKLFELTGVDLCDRRLMTSEQVFASPADGGEGEGQVIMDITTIEVDEDAIIASELIVTSAAGEGAGSAGGAANSIATVFPVQPGKKEDWIKFLSDLSGPRAEEYQDFLTRYGLTQEKYFVQMTPRGEMAILYVEGQDPYGALTNFARSSHPFDAWFREEMLLYNGIDFVRRQTAPAPHLLLDWRGEAKPMAA